MPFKGLQPHIAHCFRNYTVVRMRPAWCSMFARDQDNRPEQLTQTSTMCLSIAPMFSLLQKFGLEVTLPSVRYRRIILETPEVEADLGTTFTRALLARSEQNIYGRLTFEEFLLLAREVGMSINVWKEIGILPTAISLQVKLYRQRPPKNTLVRTLGEWLRLTGCLKMRTFGNITHPRVVSAGI